MTPQDFIAKWGAPDGVPGPAFALNEEQGAQSHFLDLCELLGVPKPGTHEGYLFEEKSKIIGGKTGYADVVLRGSFAWENKAPGKNLDSALKQLLTYSLALANPPILVVSDRLTIRVHTQFTGHPSETHTVTLYELDQPEKRALLRRIWTAPQSFKPQQTSRDITEAAARNFAHLADSLRQRGEPPERVSHFLTQCVFSLFAEDVGLLPSRMFERLLANKQATPERLAQGLTQLFETMRSGGLYGVDDIPWFNGGLFKTVAVPALTTADLQPLRDAAALNWSAIDPSIFGTLFERGLDPTKRSQLGAHYTDPATIERIIGPVIRQPLIEKWELAALDIQALQVKSTKKNDKHHRAASARFIGWLQELAAYRALDPACGSGNFLYLALKCLKDIEHHSHLQAADLGLDRQTDLVTGPHNVLGIELNEYAAELARVTVWIGELQWRIDHGYEFKTNPVLDALDHIECRDALLAWQGDNATEAEWPAADVVVGNPPFLGDKKMRAELGDPYTTTLRATYEGRVPGGADLVCYWFDKARQHIANGQLQCAGLVSTNSIRGGANRKVLDAICTESQIFAAWSDEPWVNNGAAVRVSLVAFGESARESELDGEVVNLIHADLTSSQDGDTPGCADLTVANRLSANRGIAFVGIQKTGPFEIDGALARQWLMQPNPNALPNSRVIRPWFNGLDVTRRNRDLWIVDFGVDMAQQDAALFESPFEFVTKYVKPTRVGKREARTNECYWLFQWSRPVMRAAITGLPRIIVTPEVAKHRSFTWMPTTIIADKNLSVVARADDTTFGILHSRFHELWSLRMGTSLEDRPRYTPTTCFETFPFPPGLSPADTAHQRTEAVNGGALIPADLPEQCEQKVPSALMNQAQAAMVSVRVNATAIAQAAKRLNDLRQAWLNPPEWTQTVPEVVPLGMTTSPYPDRTVARPGFEKQLADRTLTKLYNQRPAWLAQAHAALDAAVAAAYGWADYTPAMPDDEILKRLLALNLVALQG
jgi:hypothetical protein